MSEFKYYEVEGAVYRTSSSMPMEIYIKDNKTWSKYKGDCFKVMMSSNEMTPDEIEEEVGFNPES